MKIQEASIKLVCENYFEYETEKIGSSSDAIQFLTTYLKDLDREVFGVITLKNSGEPINFNIVSMGDISSAIVHPREILKVAILSNAAGIICFHNHPSGSPTPSKEDIKTTQRIKNACKIMGIQLLDHIIIGAGGRTHDSVMKYL